MISKRNALLTAVYEHIKANPASEFALALADGGTDYRFYAYEAEQGCAYPHAVMSIISDQSVGAIKTPLSTMEWQINCFSTDITEVNNLAAWCRELFEDKMIESEGCRFMCAWDAVYGPIRTDDQHPWETVVTFFTS
ncbi:MAG: DUF3168 domain-containing protein [Desulfovibrio sp.]|jgi:hypothetical protein|nr:DUF3168 domain-containing protein [Desulfovibrio sp.]